LWESASGSHKRNFVFKYDDDLDIFKEYVKKDDFEIFEKK